MAMRLPNGSRASNASENMSVFAPHFDRVFNNHRAVDPTLLDQIPQRRTMWDLNDPITWDEFCKAVKKLKNAKAPGLRLCLQLIFVMSTNISMIFSLAMLTMINGTVVNAFLSQKMATFLILTSGAGPC